SQGMIATTPDWFVASSTTQPMHAGSPHPAHTTVAGTSIKSKAESSRGMRSEDRASALPRVPIPTGVACEAELGEDLRENPGESPDPLSARFRRSSSAPDRDSRCL